MGMCPYCAQTSTRKDKHGYCKKYSCFERSGKLAKLQNLIRRADDLYLIPHHATGQVGRVVSNPYNLRTRGANDIMYDAQREFGHVPEELLQSIPMENRGKWDKNIRW